MTRTDTPITEVVVLRHGETAWNVAGRMQGHLDSPLTPLGQKQAHALARRLSHERFAGFYASDLGRALATARPIATALDQPFTPEPRLRERNLGIFQGSTIAEIQERFPTEAQRFLSGDPDHVVPEGESARQRYDRAVACLEDLAARHAGQRILLVSHGGILNGLLRKALGVSLTCPLTYKLFNATLNTFFIAGTRWQLGTWGDVHHLQTIGTIEAGAEAIA